VKRYSSGMFTRLGFAIAAHLDPDLLIVDEVLAVGDSAFQDKCLKKLNQLGTSGRTVLFVSHDIGSILTLCKKGIYLEKGQVKQIGDIESCLNAYMKTCKTQDFEWKGNIGDENLRILSAKIHKKEASKDFFYQGDPLKIEITYEIFKPIKDLYFGIGIWNQRQQLLGRSTITNEAEYPGLHRLSFNLDTGMLHEGEYSIVPECFIHNVKRILNDEIVLKCPIYVPERDTRLFYRDGIYLGDKWQREESANQLESSNV
jgi:lipopolysaccharide transport system ATP-binding protein